MSVRRIELVELIERESAKLSPRGRDLWKRLELLVEGTAAEEATSVIPPEPTAEKVEAIEGMAERGLEEMRQFYAYRDEELSGPLERWQERRKAPNDPV